MPQHQRPAPPAGGFEHAIKPAQGIAGAFQIPFRFLRLQMVIEQGRRRGCRHLDRHAPFQQPDNIFGESGAAAHIVAAGADNGQAVLGIPVILRDIAGRALGLDDHRRLVWDSFIGQWIALIPLLISALLPDARMSWWMLLPAFVLFRLFDVWKPWPIRWLDRRVKGGFGVMIDDVIAGLFAAIVLAFGLLPLP